MSKNKIIVLLYILNFIGNVSLSTAIWMLYLKSYGLSIFQITILQSILNLGMLIFEIPTGILADKIGRKLSLIIAYVLLVIHSLLMLLYPSIFLLQIAGYFIAGIGYAMVSGTSETILYEVIKHNNIDECKTKKILGVFQALGNWGLVLGLASSGILYQVSSSLVYIIITMIYALSFIISCFIDEPRQHKAKEENIHMHFINFIESIKEQKKNLVLLLNLGMIVGVVSIYYLFSQEIFTEVNMQPYVIGIIFAISHGIEGLANITSSAIEGKLSLNNIFKIALLTMLVGFILILYPNMYIYICVFIIINFMFGIIYPIIVRVINEKFISKHRAALNSSFNTISSVQMFILIPAMGFMTNYFNKPMSFFISITSIVTMLWLYITFNAFIKKSRKHEEKNIV